MKSISSKEKFLKDSQVMKSKSLRFLLELNVLLGFFFPARAFAMKRYSLKFFVGCVSSIFGVSTLVVYVCVVGKNLLIEKGDKVGERRVAEVAVLVADALCVALSVWRLGCVHLKRTQTTRLLKFVLDEFEFVGQESISRAAKIAIAFLGLYATVYTGFLLASLKYCMEMKPVIYNSSTNEFIFNASDDNTWRYIESSSLYTEIISRISPNAFVFYNIFVHLIAVLVMLRFVIADINIYFFYEVAVTAFEKLEKSVSEAVSHEKQEHLQHWLHNQHDCNRYLKMLNKLAAPLVIPTVACDTILICIVDYVVAMGIMNTTHSVVLFVFGLLSMLHIYMYCHFGQKIRDTNAAIQSAVYEGNWAGSKGTDVQGVTLMIWNSTGSLSAHPQVGAPFFNLNMEFFCSIIGAVTTYFVVLLQFK